MRRSALALLVMLFPAVAAAQGLTIGVAAPLDGPFARLGKQIINGARVAAEASDDTIFEVPETCEPGSGEEVAKRLISGGADVAIGFLCTDSLAGSLVVLNDSGIPAITLSVRSRTLFEDAAKYKWPLFTLAPAPGRESIETANIIADNWTGTPFALLDDGTINAHDLAANIRIELENQGVKPVLAENFRPGRPDQTLLAKRLIKAGIANAYIAASHDDVAIIARDIAKAGGNISLMGGESLLAAETDATLVDGTLAAMPQFWLTQPAAANALHQLGEKSIIAEGYVLPAYAAVAIADQAAAQKKDGGDLAAAIATGTFETPLGEVSFEPNGARKQTAFSLMEWRNGRFQDVIKQPDSQ